MRGAKNDFGSFVVIYPYDAASIAMKTNLAYPDKQASLRIIEELTILFAQFDFVSHIFLFGSYARGSWDRWSDIDFLLVTGGGFAQQWQLFTALQRQKAVLHHHTFTPKVEPCGAHVLGIVFRNESVFHNLDLNFLSVTEFESQKNLARFGQLKRLYFSNNCQTKIDEVTHVPDFAIDPQERKIGNRLHWTKKAIKQTLRQKSAPTELQRQLLLLDEMMKTYPEDKPMLGGNICQLARIYLEIGHLLLD